MDVLALLPGWSIFLEDLSIPSTVWNHGEKEVGEGPEQGNKWRPLCLVGPSELRHRPSLGACVRVRMRRPGNPGGRKALNHQRGLGASVCAAAGVGRCRLQVCLAGVSTGHQLLGGLEHRRA